MKTILRALIRRLSLLPDSTIDDVALKCYNDFTSSKKSDNPNLEDWKELFKNLIASGSDQYDFVFLVDALDECVDSATAEDFLEFMSTFLKSTPNVYLLCSSHKYINVDSFFGAGNAYAEEDLLEVIDVTAAKSATAMEAFITGELERRKEKAKESVFCKWRIKSLHFQITNFYFTDSKFHLDNPDYPHLLSGLKSSLTDHARGMFEWVKVWLDICLPVRDLKRKTILSDKVAEKRLQQIRDVTGA